MIESHLPPKMVDLREIPLPDSGIDDGVADLVKAINLIGIETTASCEGHISDSGHCHPWVGIKYPVLYKSELLPFLEAYNIDHEIRWELVYAAPDQKFGNPRYGMIQPTTWKEKFRCCLGEARGFEVPKYIQGIRQDELQKLQESAIELSVFISSHL